MRGSQTTIRVTMNYTAICVAEAIAPATAGDKDLADRSEISRRPTATDSRSEADNGRRA